MECLMPLFDDILDGIAQNGYHNHRLEAHSDIISHRIFSDLRAACQRPRFERRREALGDGMVGRAMPSMSLYAGFQHDEPEGEKNYGADISTLTRLIEEGKL